MGSTVLESSSGKAYFFDEATTERVIIALTGLARECSHTMFTKLEVWKELWIDMPPGCKSFENGVNVETTFSDEERILIIGLLEDLLDLASLDDLERVSATELVGVFS
ncbi:MAG: hypothetical protein GY822_21315 [Deltaproteobacteria bacterium]|nr:hypothetical protein [Deltaproteobacteria bacterium]